MEIESEFEVGEIPNSLKYLKRNSIVQILQLSVASNDLTTNLKASREFPEGENGYFFYNSICIVREIAKQVKHISKNPELYKKFSRTTSQEFEILKSCLQPFEEKSLTKSVLKPIRDIHFHYQFKSIGTIKIDNLVNQLLNSETLEVGIKCNNHKLTSIRYNFADAFRNELLDSYLDNDITKDISTIVVSIVAFVDALLTDLAKHKNSNSPLLKNLA